MQHPAIARPRKALRTYPPSCTFCWTPHHEPSRVGLCSGCADKPLGPDGRLPRGAAT